MDIVRYLVDKGADINIKDENWVSEQDYTADCKLVVQMCLSFTLDKVFGVHCSQI